MRAVIAALGVVAWVGAAAPAGADPAPTDPLIPVPAPAPTAPPETALDPQGLLGQAASALKTDPVAAMRDLLDSSPQQALVGVAPPAPGTPQPADPWTLAQALRPQNYRMPTPDQASPYALAPNDNPSPFARIDAWKGVHAMVHGNLGRMPGVELGQPLPGTAPPPGTNLPPGLEQFYIDPALAVPVAPDPLLVPPVPPAG